MTTAQTKKVISTPEVFAERARITNWAGWILLSTLAAAFIVDMVTLSILIARLRGSSIAVPELIGLSVMIVFLSIVLVTVVFFFLAGLGYIKASDKFMKWLGGITIAGLAGMATTVLGFYFNKK
jgi:hypothetical protein